jgi:hypothetical protein
MLSLIFALSISSAVFAQDGGLSGPFWGEGPTETGSGGSGDAGTNAGTAQKVASPSAGSGGSIATKIIGRTSTSNSVLTTDTVDLFEIHISSPLAFEVNSLGSSFDTALFLFRKVINANGLPEAYAVAMNDNAAVQGNTSGYSQIKNTQSPAGGPSIPNLTAGIYYLGVAKSGAIPLRCGVDPLYGQLFTYTAGSTQLVLPSQSQGNLKLCEWNLAAAGGEYTINLVGGVTLRRSSSCDSAPVLGRGTYSFGDAGTADDTEDRRIGLFNICGIGSGWLANPTWFRVAPCNGELTVRICPTNSAANNYNFVLYRGSCGNLEPIGCGSSSSFCTKGSQSTFTVEQCDDLFVAFGPLSLTAPTSVVTSPGSIVIQCAETPVCPPNADVNGDGSVTAEDLALLLASWDS